MEDYSHIQERDLLIGKHLSGNSTPEEVEELMNWLKLSDENSIYYSQYKILWLQSEKSNAKIAENKWEQLQMRIENRENTAIEINNIIEETKENSFRFLRYAAVLIGIISVTAIFYYMFNAKSFTPVISENVIDVPYGSKMKLTLPDNSIIWVNSGSKVSYNNKFGIENRDIKIKGEAFFDVAKNPKLPFVVQAGNVKIKALGTSFNVKAYPEEKRIETTLVHGSVRIEKIGHENPIYLKPSEKLVILDNEKSSENSNLATTEAVKGKKNNKVDNVPLDITIDKKIDTEKETAWKEGKLIFEREPLETLTVQLMRKYDVNISFAEERLKTLKFSGTFNDLSLEQIMDAMKFSAPIDYEIEGKNVVLRYKFR